jgi:hypothetical protein
MASETGFDMPFGGQKCRLRPLPQARIANLHFGASLEKLARRVNYLGLTQIGRKVPPIFGLIPFQLRNSYY